MIQPDYQVAQVRFRKYSVQSYPPRFLPEPRSTNISHCYKGNHHPSSFNSAHLYHFSTQVNFLQDPKMSSYTYHTSETVQHKRETTITCDFAPFEEHKPLVLPPNFGQLSGTRAFSQLALAMSAPGLVSHGVLGGGGENTTRSYHHGAVMAPASGHTCCCGAGCGRGDGYGYGHGHGFPQGQTRNQNQGHGQVQNQSAIIALSPPPPPPPSSTAGSAASVSSRRVYPDIPPGQDAISLGCIRQAN